jgi:DNA-binding winged helix-turn-helix (wHTH) protein
MAADVCRFRSTCGHLVRALPAVAAPPELLADGQPVKLGGRAFDVLMALIEARGAVVAKNALMARVWPDRIVEENNLQWQISALRAAFGADRNLIRTVSGRGYQFTAEIDTAYRSPEADAATPIGDAQPDAREARSDKEISGQLPATNLPEPISELVGREDVLDEILSLASTHRPWGSRRELTSRRQGRAILETQSSGEALTEKVLFPYAIPPLRSPVALSHPPLSSGWAVDTLHPVHEVHSVSVSVRGQRRSPVRARPNRIRESQ